AGNGEKPATETRKHENGNRTQNVFFVLPCWSLLAEREDLVFRPDEQASLGDGRRRQHRGVELVRRDQLEGRAGFHHVNLAVLRREIDVAAARDWRGRKRCRTLAEALLIRTCPGARVVGAENAIPPH